VTRGRPTGGFREAEAATSYVRLDGWPGSAGRPGDDGVLTPIRSGIRYLWLVIPSFAASPTALHRGKRKENILLPAQHPAARSSSKGGESGRTPSQSPPPLGRP
jgi:hypothetical protein